MQTWATQLAPQHTLAEFVLAAQAIAGNRELRPMLAEFRLAELRDVNHENDNRNHDDPAHAAAQLDPGPVSADVGPVNADVGPVEADLGPDDDDWDELDLVPDPPIDISPIRNSQTTPPATGAINRNDNNHSLSADIEARIEENRRAAVERRNAVVARLRADKDAEDKHTTQHLDASHEKSINKSDHTPEQRTTNPEFDAPTKSNPSPPSASEKGEHISQKTKPSQNELSSASVKPLLKEDGHNAKDGPARDATSKTDGGKQIQTHLSNAATPPDHGSQKHDEPHEKREKENSTHRNFPSTKSTQNATPEANVTQGIEKLDSASPKQDDVDQDVDMEILAEFEDGDEA